MLDGEQRGPFTLAELAAAGVRPETYVWCKGMPEWKEAAEVADICRYFRQHLSDLMHPASTPETPPAEETTDTEGANRGPIMLRRFGVELPDNADASPAPAEEKHDYTHPPHAPIVEAVLAALLCCPPVGIIAIVQAVRCSRLWKAGHAKEAYDASRAAKMWTGITFFLGFLVYAFIGKCIAG